MFKKSSIVIFSFLILACTQKPNTEYFQNQHKVADLVQKGMYYYWNGGDYKKAEKEFFKGITIKGNLEVVQKFFEDAVTLDSKRLDIQYGLASTYMFQRKFDDGFKVYDKIIEINPQESDAPIIAMMYSYASGNTNAYNKYMQIAQKNNKDKTQYYQDAIQRIEENNKTIFNVVPTKKYKDEEHSTVVLGYALAEDGTMQETLIKRLEQALALAKLYPKSKIVVSGAVPKQGQTEAGLMKEWLVKNGVPKDNIIIEDRAKDTVGNALFSVALLQEIKPKNVTLITSASHIRRSLNIFKEVDKLNGLGANWDNLVYLDYPSLDDAQKVSDTEKFVIFRDYMRSSGLWAYPGLQQ